MLNFYIARTALYASKFSIYLLAATECWWNWAQVGVEQKRETDTMDEQKRHLREAETDVEAKRRAVDNQRQTAEEKREQVDGRQSCEIIL